VVTGVDDDDGGYHVSSVGGGEDADNDDDADDDYQYEYGDGDDDDGCVDHDDDSG